MEQPFHTTTSKPLNTGNPEKSTKSVTDDCYEYLKKKNKEKKVGKVSKLKDQRKALIETTNQLSVLSPD